MASDLPEKSRGAPLVVPPNREEVTGEPEADVHRLDPRFPDVSWLHHPSQYGGGHVPEDYTWSSNPKQRQDDLMGEWPDKP
jgi:hypothetical protein